MYGRTLGVLIPCTACGHRNRLAGSVMNGYKIFLKDQMQNCIKCKTPLKKGDYGLKRTKTLIEAEKELIAEGVELT